MNNIFFRSSFFMIGIILFSECLYSAEKKYRPRIATPPSQPVTGKPQKYIPYDKRNNQVYVEVKQPVNKTPIVIRYFTREEGCAPGHYFKYETITPLANIRSNPYSCVVKRKSNGTSLFTFTCQNSNTTIAAKANDTFIVHPEDNKQIRITKSGSDTIVAQFIIK
jgi:hypothetical protein